MVDGMAEAHLLDTHPIIAVERMVIPTLHVEVELPIYVQ
jgi:hypothetical protein